MATYTITQEAESKARKDGTVLVDKNGAPRTRPAWFVRSNGLAIYIYRLDQLEAARNQVAWLEDREIRIAVEHVPGLATCFCPKLNH